MMKKYLLAAALGIASIAFGQNYPYGNNYPYGQQQSGWYGNGDDYYNYAYNNFPDDYYYDFPMDYYPSAYYQSYYNDYRRSITGIDWNWLFSNYHLSNYQIRQIIALNNRFNSFSSWNAYYGMNPDRWYYDRFYALERILGPQIIIVIQNRYYNGYSPVRYYQNYRRTYYQPRYVVVPKYRYINVNNYRIDRDRYFQNQGTFRTDRVDNSRNVWSNGNSGQMREGTRNGERPDYGNLGNSGYRRESDAVNRNIQRESSNSQNQNGWRSGSREMPSPQPQIHRESSNETQSGWRGGSREMQSSQPQIHRESNAGESGWRGGSRNSQSSGDTVFRSGGR